ncbi:eukaryotic elongation factor 2 kinase isoform X7 [Molossus molossus]|uniref:eukaryotic elongation factor 2 kinase isoform X7 n=1 Tax=Molossus molossus TaxID=27622 RepID=UPI001747CE21|nr:eukaryotic elongation factor 2 kinase isoform X7 [Molossus molossus]
MADEDLIFRLEGVDGGPASGPGHGGDCDADSDDEEGYFICPLTDDPGAHQNGSPSVNNYCSNLVKREQYSFSASPGGSFNFKEAWKQAIEKAKHMPDPWAEFHLEDIPAEYATRHRYNAVTGQWLEDDVLIKMASQPFGRGAMRECFRTKKLSNFLHTQQWKGASNYVAKRYIEPVDRDVYFEDVRLQMEAKLWGEEYNRHKPPKQVDIVQMCVLELKERPGTPLFHLEHYIEGKYIKYNSNSGFVRDDMRLTPQAFSHFTFERSGHQLIVVDIQGVGDLYTDPQIHTEKGTDFGDGNLDWPVFSDPDSMAPQDHNHLDNHRDSENSGDSGYPSEKRGELDDPEPQEHGHSDGSRRCESDEDSLGSSGRVCVEKWNLLNSSRLHLPRPSAVAFEVQRLNTLDLEKKIGKSILGKVHLAMVRYHEGGRFCKKDEEWDRESAVFHLEHAADLGELEAIVGLGLMYSQLPHHILADVSLKETEENKTKGFDYLLKAAGAGDRQSMILVARAFDTGQNLSPDRSQDWPEALRWYSSALETTDCDEAGEYDGVQGEPRHVLLAREAEMLLAGGFRLEKDPQRAGDLYTQAAEAAMEALRGRLASQYYQRAEEAWAQAEE